MNYYAYVDYGVTPAQYHAGLDKLWDALLESVQESSTPTVPWTGDVFTLAAKTIIDQRKDIEALQIAYKTQGSLLDLERASQVSGPRSDRSAHGN